MQEADRVAKILRSVLQSHKNGVPFSRLQREYKSFTGDMIPFKQLGHPTLEEYLESIPGFVDIEVDRSGEVICRAVVCKETADIAQLVACQRTSKKKSIREVNCRMRLKRTAPLASVGKPKGTLRKPGLMDTAKESKRPVLSVLRSKGNYTAAYSDVSPVQYPLSPKFGMSAPKEDLTEGHMTMMNRPEKKVMLPPRFQKENPVHLSKNLPLDLNENMKETTELMPTIPPYTSDTNEIQKRIKEIINNFSNGILLSKISHLYKETYAEELNVALLPQLESWPHVCVAEKVCFGGRRDICLYPPGKTSHSGKAVSSQEGRPQLPSLKETPETKATVDHGELKQQVASILLNYCSGLWANALPTIYENTYKRTFPQDILNNLDSLSDICTIDYVAGTPKKAILYAKSKQQVDKNLNVTGKKTEDLQQLAEPQPTEVLQESQEKYSENITVPPLIIPEEISPSVLVVELNSTNEVVVRYVGKDYSAAQELMEDEMKDWYHQNASTSQIQLPVVGQVVAVFAEEDAWLRAQVVSIEDNRVKVYYVDYGFNEIIENTRVYKLPKRFYSLPFQASKCRLAGLEAFCDDVVLMKTVESQTCGKIFAVEILEKSDIPLVILYDTSGEDDININTACLKTLCDKSLELHLQVNAVYTNVQVTNVCSDGTLYCQVPSKGLAKLSEVLQKLENYLHHKHSTEYSVSLPYCGMICLLNCKGKWTRVQITSVHSTRTLDVHFMDTGTLASVKVAELREIPLAFLHETIAIPPQAIKCCLADVPLNFGMWTPDAVLWLRDTVLNCPECSIKVVKMDDRISYIYLFTPTNFPDPDHSINRQIMNADLWKHQKDVFLSVKASNVTGKGDGDLPELVSLGKRRGFTDSVSHTPETSNNETALSMPPPLPLAQPEDHMDVFVSLACHPGYFVLQSWQELHNIEVLVEEMLLYYSAAEERAITVEKNKLYAAKVKDKWHRVIVKGMLAKGLVSVYELDYGEHELVSVQNIRPLMNMFRKLPFQAITAQLAGVKCQQWSEEASIVFRNHVENKPLVAQVQAIIDAPNPWERKVVVYLVDTSLPDTDIWIHDIMTQYCIEILKTN